MAVRHRLTLPPVRWTSQLEAMSASDAASGLVARAANRQLTKSDREAAGVLSSARARPTSLTAAHGRRARSLRFGQRPAAAAHPLEDRHPVETPEPVMANASR